MPSDRAKHTYERPRLGRLLSVADHAKRWLRLETVISRHKSKLVLLSKDGLKASGSGMEGRVVTSAGGDIFRQWYRSFSLRDVVQMAFDSSNTRPRVCRGATNKLRSICKVRGWASLALQVLRGNGRSRPERHSSFALPTSNHLTEVSLD